MGKWLDAMPRTRGANRDRVECLLAQREQSFIPQRSKFP
jgi:hypothetical protein